MRASIRVVVRLLTIVLIVSGAQSRAQVRVLKAGMIVNPETGKTLSNAMVIVEGERIKSIGTGLPVPTGAETIDLSSMTLLPGMIDSHTHMCDMFDAKQDVGGELLLYSLVVSTADRAFHGAANAQSMLMSGFTTVRDMGNAGNFADAALKRAIEAGIVEGPTLFISGKIIAPYGGQFFVNAEHPEISDQDYFVADTHDELKKAIRKNIHFGADWIKIVIDDYPYMYSEDDVRFIVEEARRAGRRVAAHSVTEEGVRNSIRGGVASIEHGFAMSDEALTLAKEKGVVLCATDLTPELMNLYNFFTASYEEIVDRLRRAYAIGTPVAFGSDIIANVPGHSRGSASISLVDTWVDAGIAPLEILRALTTNGARLLWIDRERGAIREGFYADIIAVPSNPLTNIATLKDVRFVMKNGKVVKR